MALLLDAVSDLTPRAAGMFLSGTGSPSRGHRAVLRAGAAQMMLVRIFGVLLLCSIAAGLAAAGERPCAGFDCTHSAQYQAIDAQCGDDMDASAACAAACAAGGACISTATRLPAAQAATGVIFGRLPELLSIRPRAPDPAPPKHFVA